MWNSQWFRKNQIFVAFTAKQFRVLCETLNDLCFPTKSFLSSVAKKVFQQKILTVHPQEGPLKVS